jgi:hypothetical protein
MTQTITPRTTGRSCAREAIRGRGSTWQRPGRRLSAPISRTSFPDRVRPLERHAVRSPHVAAAIAGRHAPAGTIADAVAEIRKEALSRHYDGYRGIA